ncbi:hypothetical protein ASPZODRAFT_69040 [Penicilliopsis zonata CBS 506.65]|uniref:Zn(2)-C6 fungal-type domain-containing protein n=1 Tax=Penicilliopsis zonata CBS 506.65 TaxID=1073090 RepID=A0A1L9SFF4_9EURO|nr:hypothetical protein ASPZODRAFT_69040 [Penicilliopsis zonata CBS 506.65]OJJ45807.1 hypothetical protein ASPZODRAFT_69040 [Penicilliopsis zonata CBS 506.65]
MMPSPPNGRPGLELPGQASQALFQFHVSQADVSMSTVRATTGKGPLAPGRQITRNRASYSCHTCRRRKVKCDKIHPVCGNCRRNNTECVYDTAQRKGSSRLQHEESSDGHVTKRRREESPQPDNPDGVEEVQMVYGQVKQEPKSAGANAIEARLDKLSSMIERFSKANPTLDPAEMKTLRRKALGAASQGQAMEKSSSASRGTSPHRNADSSGDEFPIPSGHATDPVDPMGSLNLGHLSLDERGRSRYVGTTYWAYISHEINELNQMLKEQNRSYDNLGSDESASDGPAIASTGIGPQTSRWKGLPNARTPPARQESFSQGEIFQRSILFPSAGSPSVQTKIVDPEMLAHLPTKRQSHILYKGFMSGIHAVSPVIHPPTILKLYNAFWEWYDNSSYSGEPCPDPTFIPLLYAIWYCGSVTISIRSIKADFNVSSRHALSHPYHDETTRWLSKTCFLRSPSLHGLAAYVLVQTVLSKEEEPLTSSLFVSLGMRVAQSMGLHRDPAKFGIASAEAEYRRRLWWHIMYMDCIIAMASGLPPIIPEDTYWDVRQTNEIKDTLLGTAQAEKYERLVATGMRPPDNPDDPTLCGGRSMVNVYYLWAKGKYIMTRAVRRILRIQVGTREVTRKDLEELKSILVDLQVKMSAVIDRIPLVEPSIASPISQSIPSSSPPSNQPGLPGEGSPGCMEQYHSHVLVAFHKWAKIVLSMFIDKSFCVAYQPFLKNAKSRIWSVARQSALRHCYGFMEKFISVATESIFQPFHWSWPGNHQPMHATMILLIDLYERPYSSEAPRSRAFIDKIFSMIGPDGGVVGGAEDGIPTQRPLKDGGREAWDMLQRLRYKAWQKAGLDPTQLWTEQAQVQARTASHPSIPGSPFPSTSSTQPPSRLPLMMNRQPSDSNKTFFDITCAAHPSPKPDQHYQLPPVPPSLSAAGLNNPSRPAYTLLPPISTTRPMDPVLTTPFTSPSPAPGDTLPAPNNFSTTAPSSSMHASVMGSSSSPSHDRSAPTPPSMIDPNFAFDWDQWDAVFGHYLPVADDLMDLDPMAGFEFPDLKKPA